MYIGQVNDKFLCERTVLEYIWKEINRKKKNRFDS